MAQSKKIKKGMYAGFTVLEKSKFQKRIKGKGLSKQQQKIERDLFRLKKAEKSINAKEKRLLNKELVKTFGNKAKQVGAIPAQQVKDILGTAEEMRKNIENSNRTAKAKERDIAKMTDKVFYTGIRKEMNTDTGKFEYISVSPEVFKEESDSPLFRMLRSTGSVNVSDWFTYKEDYDVETFLRIADGFGYKELRDTGSFISKIGGDIYEAKFDPSAGVFEIYKNGELVRTTKKEA